MKEYYDALYGKRETMYEKEIYSAPYRVTVKEVDGANVVQVSLPEVTFVSDFDGMQVYVKVKVQHDANGEARMYCNLEVVK